MPNSLQTRIRRADETYVRVLTAQYEKQLSYALSAGDVDGARRLRAELANEIALVRPSSAALPSKHGRVYKQIASWSGSVAALTYAAVLQSTVAGTLTLRGSALLFLEGVIAVGAAAVVVFSLLALSHGGSDAQNWLLAIGCG